MSQNRGILNPKAAYSFLMESVWICAIQLIAMSRQMEQWLEKKKKKKKHNEKERNIRPLNFSLSFKQHGMVAA